LGKKKKGGKIMRQWLSTKEKCILRDLIKLEIRSLDRDDYGKYKYFPFEYAEQLLKLGNKLQLDEQQKVKANKLYRKDRI
jgi:hypothetical protein